MIPAGGSGKLVAKVHTHAQQNGRISKTIRVVTNDPGLKQIVLRLNATVIAPIEVRPSPRLWLNTWENRPAETKVLLHRQDGKPLKILQTHIEPAGLVKVTWSGVTKAEDQRGLKAGPGDVWMMVSFPAAPHAMSRSGKVELMTNDPRQPKLVLPLFVHVRSTLEIVPPRLQFIVGIRGPKEYWRVVEVRAHGSTRFHIRSVETDHPELLKIVIMPPGLGTVERVRVGLDRAAGLKAAKRGLHATLTVKTDDPKHPSMTIPVFVTTRRAVPLPPKIHLLGPQGAPIKRVLRPKRAPVKKVPGDPKLPPPGSSPLS